MKNLWNNEAGFVISAELVLVLTIAVLGTIVGLSHVVMAVNQELTDAAQAIGSLNQSFRFTGFKCCPCPGGLPSSATAGSAFNDLVDLCDNSTCTDVATCEVSVEGPKTF